MRVTASQAPRLAFDVWNVFAIGPSTWPTSALANTTTATAAEAVARNAA